MIIMTIMMVTIILIVVMKICYANAGVVCEKEINECHSNPCQNEATCLDMIAGYRCECAPGFLGNNCEQNMNECLSNPCRHNATCEDGINSFT